MAPTILNYGMGVDSTAMLIELVEQGNAPDLVIFADTGAEHPETYAYLDVIGPWLAERGLEIQIVRRAKSRPSKTGPGYTTFEGACLQNDDVPSLAYHRKGCSGKWKADPMDRWIKSWGPAMQAWANGEKVQKLIGYDCSGADLRRSVKPKTEDDKYLFSYPLQAWGWTRTECKARIAAAGLPIPRKSSCFFCPAMKEHEVRDLAENYPELFRRALAIEDQAGPAIAARQAARYASWVAAGSPISSEDIEYSYMHDGRRAKAPKQPMSPETKVKGLWGEKTWRGWAEAEGLIEIAPAQQAVAPVQQTVAPQQPEQLQFSLPTRSAA